MISSTLLLDCRKEHCEQPNEVCLIFFKLLHSGGFQSYVNSKIIVRKQSIFFLSENEKTSDLYRRVHKKILVVTQSDLYISSYMYLIKWSINNTSQTPWPESYSRDVGRFICLPLSKNRTRLLLVTKRYPEQDLGLR